MNITGLNRQTMLTRRVRDNRFDIEEVTCLQERVEEGKKYAIKQLASKIRNIGRENSNIKQQNEYFRGLLVLSHDVCDHYKSYRDNSNKWSRTHEDSLDLVFKSQCADLLVKETIICSQQKNIHKLEEELEKARNENIKHLNASAVKEKTQQQQNIDNLKKVEALRTERDFEKQTRKEQEEKMKREKNESQHLKERNEKKITSQNLRIHQLENDLKHRDHKEKDLEKLSFDKKSHDIEKIELDKKLTEMNEQLQTALLKLKKGNAELAQAKIQENEQKLLIQTLEQKKKENKNNIRKLEEAYNAKIKEHTQNIQEIQDEVKRKELKIKELQGALHKQEVEHSIYERKGESHTVTMEYKLQHELHKELKERKDQLAVVTDQLQMASSELKNAKADVDEANNKRHKQKLIIQKLEQQGNENENNIRHFKEEQNSLKQNNQHLQDEIDCKDLKLKDLQDALHKQDIKGKHENEHSIYDRQRESHIVAIEHKLRQAQIKLKEAETELERVKCQRDAEQRTKADIERNEEEKLSALRIEQQQNIKTLQKVEADLDKMRTERDFEQRTRQQLEKKLREEEYKFKSLKETRDEIITSRNQRMHQHESELKMKGLANMTYENRSEDKDKRDLTKELKKSDDKLTKVNDQLHKTLKKLTETEAELNETKTRLSKAMGDRLTDNNPNIADLSDKNRPVKLAERYAELYDNQWTDAFDILGKYFEREQQTIEALLAVQQDVMRFCVESGSKQMKDLQSVLGFSNVPTGDMPADVRKSLKDGRKAASSIALRNLYEAYLSHLKRSTSQTFGRAFEILQYVHESLEICWLMVIQDPPVAFAPVAKPGSELNTDIFKPYTSSGTHVEYTVWPALLLHEGGPVLAKGVAQGYGKKTK